MNTTTANRLQSGDPAPKVQFLDVEAATFSLADLYQHAPTALLFLRHLG